jgi:hypothetical protein
MLQTITFTVTANAAGAVVITGPVPAGKYTITVGTQPGSNSEYLAIVSPVGVAEETGFQSGDL